MCGDRPVFPLANVIRFLFIRYYHELYPLNFKFRFLAYGIPHRNLFLILDCGLLNSRFLMILGLKDLLISKFRHLGHPFHVHNVFSSSQLIKYIIYQLII